MIIEEKLAKYKEITIEIIEKLHCEEDLNYLMDERFEILKELFQDESLNKDEIKVFYEKLEIKAIDEKLKERIQAEQSKIKEEIREIHNRKQASTIYNNHLGKVNFLNKMI